MSDLYGTSSQAISMGNAQMSSVRDYNDRVREHNSNVTDTIQGLKEQEKTANTIQQVKDQATNLWTASDIPAKAKAYNDYFASRAAGTAKASNPLQNAQNTLRDAAKARVQSAGQLTSDISKSSPVLSDANKLVTSGLAKEGENLLAGTKLGAIGEKVGVLGSVAQGGMDLFDDIKSGGIAGNNSWEKTGNVLQIGGTVADMVGTVFPPAKLIGGILDLSSGITQSIGDKLDADKQASDLKTQQASETETTEAAPAQQTITTGRVQ